MGHCYEGRRFGLFQDANRGETGMYAPTLFFLISFDYVVRIASEESRGGIWGISSGHVEYLDDLNYADDLVVFACTQGQIQDKKSIRRK